MVWLVLKNQSKIESKWYLKKDIQKHLIISGFMRFLVFFNQLMTLIWINLDLNTFSKNDRIKVL